MASDAAALVAAAQAQVPKTEADVTQLLAWAQARGSAAQTAAATAAANAETGAQNLLAAAQVQAYVAGAPA